MKNSHKSKIRVRYSETDQMGVVYHGNYAQYFEIGRTEWLRDLGFNYKKLEEEGVLLPVVHLNCDYKKSALYDDLLTVTTTIKNEPSVKIEFDYVITNQKDEILCTGATILVFLDAKTMKPMRCPKSILEALRTQMT